MFVVHSIILPILFTLTSLFISIYLPTIKNSQTIDLDLGKIYYLNIPSFPLLEIRERHVTQLVSKENYPFGSCQPIPPSITFNKTDEVMFDGPSSKRPMLIYNFQDLQYSKKVLDAYHQGSDFYMFFQDGTVVYIKLTEYLTVFSQKIMKAIGIKKGQKLEEGYFVKVGQYLAFISDQYAFSVTNEKVQKMKGYKPEQMFESVSTINFLYFGVVYQHAIQLYKLEDIDIQLVDTYRVANPEVESYKDIIFYLQQNALLVIDEYVGIIELDVQIQSETPKIKGRKQVVFSAQFCKIFNINNITKKIHVICDKIYELDLSIWPKPAPINYHPRPGLKVRQIYSFNALTAYVGVDAFMITYWNKKAAVYQERNLDRVILTPTLFITVNEVSMIIGKYWVQNPEIKCNIQDQHLLGDHELIFKTKADCSRQFYMLHNISQEQYTFNNGDACIYSFQQKVHVWKPGNFMEQEIEIILLTFVIILIVGLMFLGYQRLRLMRAQQNYIFQISELKGDEKKGGESEKPMKLNQMQDNPRNQSKQYFGDESEVEGKQYIEEFQNPKNDV